MSLERRPGDASFDFIPAHSSPISSLGRRAAEVKSMPNQTRRAVLTKSAGMTQKFRVRARPSISPNVFGVEASMTTREHPSTVQHALFRRGGRRVGAGRKRTSERARVAHVERMRITKHDPVLVTTRLAAGLPNLRRECTLHVLRAALAAGSDRFGFRLVEYSIQTNHLHFVAEAESEQALARGMQGVLVRVAKALNRVWGRIGRVVGDRYHARVLRTPREVRNALVYVLQNARKHGARLTGIDACSSGAWFRGWRDRAARSESPLPRAASWLLRTGWRKWGEIATNEHPVRVAPT